MRCKVIIFSLALICLGCIPKTQPNAFDGISALYPNVSRQLAEDAARQLASAFPPGQTEFSVNSETAFGKALEDSLRRKGFMVSSEGPPIQYSVDVLHDTASPSCYVRLSFPDGASISQMYNVAGGMVVPAGNIAKTGLPDFALQPAQIAPAEPEAKAELAAALATLGQTSQEFGDQKKPLREAIVSVLVYPWKYTIPNEAKRTLKVSWPPAAGWRDAIHIMAEQAGCVAEFDEENHRVAIKDAEPEKVVSPVIVPILPAPVAEAPASSTLPEAPLVPSPTVVAVPLADPTPQEWTITPDMLRGQLESWTSQAGYQLVWKARHDFEMQSQAIFRDDFVGAVKRLFARMHLHGNPLRATIYQDNKVLEVVEE